MNNLYNFVYITKVEPTMDHVPCNVMEIYQKKSKKLKKTPKTKFTSKQMRMYHNIKQPGFDVQRRQNLSK